MACRLFLQSDDGGQAKQFLSKVNCIDILKAQNRSNLSHAGNRYGVSLVDFALIDRCLKCTVPYSLVTLWTARMEESTEKKRAATVVDQLIQDKIEVTLPRNRNVS